MKAYFARLSPRALVNSYVKLVFTYHISHNALKKKGRRGERLEGQSCAWGVVSATFSLSLKPDFLRKS